MPKSGAYGSVRGALSNERPYRDPLIPGWALAAPFFVSAAPNRVANLVDETGVFKQSAGFVVRSGCRRPGRRR